MVEEVIVARLKSYAGVSALTSGRVYPVHLPQNPTLPCNTFEVITTRPENILGGCGGLTETWIQISSWATTYNAAQELDEQVRLGLENYYTTATGVAVSGIDKDSHRDEYEDTVQAFRRVADYTVWHSVEIPS